MSCLAVKGGASLGLALPVVEGHPWVLVVVHPWVLPLKVVHLVYPTFSCGAAILTFHGIISGRSYISVSALYHI